MQGKFLTLVTAVSFTLLASINANAAPVFKVTKGNDTVYIGGTIHLLTDKDYPLQAEFAKAYNAADEVYFETDIGQMEDPAFQMKFIPYITYQDGRTLKTGLKDITFKRLDAYMKSKGLPIEQFLPLNPTGIMLTLTVMEYQAKGFTAQGVDSYYHKIATGDNKTVAWFESPEQQLEIIASFGNSDPDGMINYTLEELEKGNGMIDALHSSWRKGDMEKLAQVGLDSFEGYEALYDSLILNRNNAWIEAIEPMFGDEGTEFILVGALHLPGPDGVLTQLKKKGYKVEKL